VLALLSDLFGIGFMKHLASGGPGDADQQDLEDPQHPCGGCGAHALGARSGGSGATRVGGMAPDRRQRLGDLNLRDFCLYRAICLELEALDETIQLQGLLGRDFLELSVAMRDRRLLVEWLRDLSFPPSSDYSDSGITPELEGQLLAHSVD